MWRQVLDIYCERGSDPSFWGEPINAITNLGFIIAGFWLIGRAREDSRALSMILAVLVVIIGIGSFLFHTLATRWAGAADVIPILLFMLSAVYAIGARGVGARWAGLAAVVGFIGLMYAARTIGPQIAPQLGSSIGYAPALLMLLLSGAALAAQAAAQGVTQDASQGATHNRAGRLLLAAGAVFAVSLTLRTLDQPTCDATWRIGTHFLWHLFNAATLALTTAALLRLPPPSTDAARPA